MTKSSETRATLWVILVSATLTVMAGAILGPIVPAIQSSLEVSESFAGLIITTHGALIVLVSPIAGAVIDLWIRVSLVGIGILTAEARVVIASVDTFLHYAREISKIEAAEEAGDLDDLENVEIEASAEAQ